jgi:hypothetical protein
MTLESSDPINRIPLETSETRRGGFSNHDETNTSYVVEREKDDCDKFRQVQ